LPSWRTVPRPLQVTLSLYSQLTPANEASQIHEPV